MHDWVVFSKARVIIFMISFLSYIYIHTYIEKMCLSIRKNLMVYLKLNKKIIPTILLHKIKTKIWNQHNLTPWPTTSHVTNKAHIFTYLSIGWKLNLYKLKVRFALVTVISGTDSHSHVHIFSTWLILLPKQSNFSQLQVVHYLVKRRIALATYRFCLHCIILWHRESSQLTYWPNKIWTIAQ